MDNGVTKQHLHMPPVGGHNAASFTAGMCGAGPGGSSFAHGRSSSSLPTTGNVGGFSHPQPSPRQVEGIMSGGAEKAPGVSGTEQ